jgi:glycosyltransferase involved in cell wall biosynthesis
MSNRIKIELIASLLQSKGHELELISQGEVIEPGWKLYKAFEEPERFHDQIPVWYSSALPIRRLNGFWSNARTVHEFKSRHRAHPFDLLIIFNLTGPQVACAKYAIQHLRIPVILEYEDDRFVDVRGQSVDTFTSKCSLRIAKRLLPRVSGGIAVSPHLLSQLPSGVPTLLLRGVVGQDIINASNEKLGRKKNVVLFSGTHTHSNGVAELIEAWRKMTAPNWELHITGCGGLTGSLRQMAADVKHLVFHGLVSRPELVEIMSSAKICMNPHQVSKTPGNVFAFKIVEYIAAGAHVITTRMGNLEPELEAAITYMPDNTPATIQATIERIIQDQDSTRTAAAAAHRLYGPEAVSHSLDTLVRRVRTTSSGSSECRSKKPLNL